MNTRNRTRPTTPAALMQDYQEQYARLAPRLLTPWQRCALGISMLIEAGELPPGLFSSAKIITALIQRRTNAFDGIPEVYQRGTVDAVLGACSVADRRGRWRHNAVIAALPLVKVKGRDALPSEAAIAKDGEARTTLRRLAARLPHGTPDGLAAPAPRCLWYRNTTRTCQCWSSPPVHFHSPLCRRALYRTQKRRWSPRKHRNQAQTPVFRREPWTQRKNHRNSQHQRRPPAPPRSWTASWLRAGRRTPASLPRPTPICCGSSRKWRRVRVWQVVNEPNQEERNMQFDLDECRAVMAIAAAIEGDAVHPDGLRRGPGHDSGQGG